MRARLLWTVAPLLLLAGFVCAASADSDRPMATGLRVLALLEDMGMRNTHSIFFRDLAARGFQITFVQADDPAARLRQYGVWLYDHVVLFAPGAVPSAHLDAGELVDFVDAGGNLLAGASSELGELVREVAAECGVDFDFAGSAVVDHLNFDASDIAGDHSLLVADGFVRDCPHVLPAPLPSPVLFRGIAHRLADEASAAAHPTEGSALQFRVLSAAPSAYSHAPEDAAAASGSLLVAGSRTALVSALQARNNARVVFSGSLELFGDEFFGASVQRYAAAGPPLAADAAARDQLPPTPHQASGNRALASHLAAWAFGQRGVLRLGNVTHRLQLADADADADANVKADVNAETDADLYAAADNASAAPTTYRVFDNISFALDMQQWDGASRTWQPYVADDVQLEFVRIDPWVRRTLVHRGLGHYETVVQAPDMYGVYTLRVNYRRRGLSFLESRTLVGVRPLAHNEYMRFIPMAYPYYAAAGSMLVGFVVFSVVYLFHRDKKKAE